MMLVFLIACGYPAEEFMADVDEAACEWQTDCYEYESLSACISDAEAARESPPECAYDSDAAEECVWQYEERECPDGDAGEAGVPAACLDVWDC